MNKEQFSFDLIDKLTPDAVIEKSLRQIKEVSGGYVIGKIESYNGPLQDYTRKVKTGLASALENISDINEETFCVQDALGEQGRESHAFEIFLSAKVIQHYKYRIMFLEYGTVSYPAKIILNESLARDCFEKYTSTFHIETMKEMEELINAILDSDTMIKIIQSLIYESLRKEM